MADIGTHNARIGFSGEDAPRLFLPSAVGRVPGGGSSGDSFFVGPQALRVHRSGMVVASAAEDSDSLEALWRAVFEEQLRIDSSERPVLYSRPITQSRKDHEKTMQILFETFNVPALYAEQAAVLHAFAVGRATALVVDAGASSTRAVPVVEGHAMRTVGFWFWFRFLLGESRPLGCVGVRACTHNRNRGHRGHPRHISFCQAARVSALGGRQLTEQMLGCLQRASAVQSASAAPGDTTAPPPALRPHYAFKRHVLQEHGGAVEEIRKQGLPGSETEEKGGGDGGDMMDVDGYGNGSVGRGSGSKDRGKGKAKVDARSLVMIHGQMNHSPNSPARAQEHWQQHWNSRWQR